MSEMADEKKKILKEIFKQLHSGASPEEVKQKFKQILEHTTPLEIAKIEEELIKEGIKREEIQRLCEVHLAVFKEQLEKQTLDVSQASPINILLEEHKMILHLLENLNIIANKVQHATDVSHLTNEFSQLKHIAEELLDAEKHYLREENVLFPVLEKHGIKEPPAIMWMEHTQLREKKKQLLNLSKSYADMNFQEFKKQLMETVQALSNILSSHIFKENNILFPAALRVVTPSEWKDIRKDFDEIGYCCFTPQQLTQLTEVEEPRELKAETLSTSEGILQFETGSLSREELEAVLNTLPVDITFVDKDDTVKYFNKGEGRIFVRTKAVIGRKVQLCHPQKSIHIVNKILEAFKTGKKNVAEFWIQMGDKLVHIRYFAVRNMRGEYLGTMEVTQDITDLKKIEGEKRLLDWED
jgi:PAS domain S-box-containing protein